MGLFGRKEKINLEQMAREAIIAKGIRFVETSPDGRSYLPVNISGTGASKSDFRGALEHFKGSLNKYSPECVLSGSIRESTEILYADIKRPTVIAISATGYRPIPPAAA